MTAMGLRVCGLLLSACVCMMRACVMCLSNYVCVCVCCVCVCVCANVCEWLRVAHAYLKAIGIDAERLDESAVNLKLL